MTRPLETRFWAKVRKGGDNDCWLWTGYKVKGYGRIRDQYAFRPAHRVAYTLSYGDPGDLLVCHKCDNPACCNPGHLFLGTVQANNQDRDAKNRARGPHGATPVSMVREIKRLLADGKATTEVARLTGTAYHTVIQIKIGRRHAHVEASC